MIIFSTCIGGANYQVPTALRVNWTISIAIIIILAKVHSERREFTFNFSFQSIVLLSFMLLMSMTMKWMLSSSLFTFSYPSCRGQTLLYDDYDYDDDDVIIHTYNDSIILYVRWKRLWYTSRKHFFPSWWEMSLQHYNLSKKTLQFYRISFTFPYKYVYILVFLSNFF